MDRAIFPIISLVGFLSLLLLYIAGVGFKSGAFELGQAFILMRYCAFDGIASIGVIIFYLLWQRPMGIRLRVLFL
jgi:hypothetical protein